MLDHAQQVLVRYRETGRRVREAKTLNDIGWYRAGLGDHRQALDYCQRALAMQQELGDTQYATGERRAAQVSWRQALALFEDRHHPDADLVRAKLGR